MRNLEEMYDQLRSEYESIKCSAIQPANNLFSRAQPDPFASPANMMDNRDSMKKGNPILFIRNRYGNINISYLTFFQKKQKDRGES